MTARSFAAGTSSIRAEERFPDTDVPIVAVKVACDVTVVTAVAAEV